MKELSAEAKETALKAKVSIHNSRIQWAGLLVLIGVMVSSIAVAAVNRVVADLRQEAGRLQLEAEHLRNWLEAEQITLDQMRSETWGIQLVEEDGLRFILLQPGDRVESHENHDRAVRRYVIGEGENRQEAVRVLP